MPGMASPADPGQVELSSSLGGRMVAAWVTVTLIGLCVAAFVASLGACAAQSPDPLEVLGSSWWQMESCGPTLDAAGALRLSRLWLDGSWWRVISAGFLHGSMLHLVLNVWSLWVVGELAEAAWGHARLAVLFLLSSVGGCLASAAWVEAPMIVGASAGIMGIAGAILVGRLMGRGRVATALQPLSARVLGGWLVVLVALGFFIDMIAQAGHIGGLVVGLLLGLGWSRKEASMVIAGRLGVGMVMTGLLLAARQPEGRDGYYQFLGQGLLDRGQDAEAVAAFEIALERSPDDPGLANDLAYGLAKAGTHLDRAEELVRGALGAKPEEPAFIDTLGWVLCRRGEREAGMEALEKASRLSEGEDEEIEEHRAQCADASVGEPDGVSRETVE